PGASANSRPAAPSPRTCPPRTSRSRAAPEAGRRSPGNRPACAQSTPPWRWSHSPAPNTPPGRHPMTGYDDPGAQLRALRQQLGWSQEELANRAGLSTGVIKKIEGGGTARMETLRALARALGVHTVWFVRPGSPAPTVDNGNDAVLADMRAAILPPVGLDGRPLGTADHDDVHLPRLADAATEANHIYHADRYDDLARLLPG